MSNEEEKRKKHREAQARYRAKNRTAINEKKRRAYIPRPRSFLNHPDFGDCYSLDQVAKMLGRNPHTVKEWTRRGIIPKGRLSYRNQQVYTLAEVEVLISAMKLLTSGFTSRYAYDQTIEVNGKRYSWRQYVWDRIHDLRRNQNGNG